jgi:hypothetical protein
VVSPGLRLAVVSLGDSSGGGSSRFRPGRDGRTAGRGSCGRPAVAGQSHRASSQLQSCPCPSSRPGRGRRRPAVPFIVSLHDAKTPRSRWRRARGRRSPSGPIRPRAASPAWRAMISRSSSLMSSANGAGRLEPEYEGAHEPRMPSSRAQRGATTVRHWRYGPWARPDR